MTYFEAFFTSFCLKCIIRKGLFEFIDVLRFEFVTNLVYEEISYIRSRVYGQMDGYQMICF